MSGVERVGDAGSTTPPSVLRSTRLQLTFAFIAVLVLLRIPLFVWGDTWFNLVLGREVAESGILTSNTTTAVASGVRLVDVQWLAHLVFYAVADSIGVGGLVITGALLVAASFAGGAMAGIALGGTPGRVLLATLLAFVAMGGQVVLRAQTLAYPMFVLFPAMMLADLRSPSRRIWWLVPLAALWANLHGSVLLAPIFAGALLVGRQLDHLRRQRATNLHEAGRDLLLLALLAAAVLCTPYGLSVGRYYLETAGSKVFRDYVTEWYPLWSNGDVGGIALLVAVVLACWKGWRETDSFTLFLLGGLGIMFVSSVRHATPLALASLVLLPAVLDRALGGMYTLDFAEISPTLIRRGAMATALACLVALAPLVQRQQRQWEPSALVRAVAAEGRAVDCMLVDEQQADRFLWYFPELRGIVAHDVRVETLPPSYLSALGAAYAALGSPASVDFFRRFPLVVMDRRMHPELIERLASDANFVKLGQDATVAAFRHRGRILRSGCSGAST